VTVFNPGDRVDILLPGAEVVSHGPTQLQFTLPGVPDRTFAVPIRDDRAREIVEVTAAVPRPRAGDVYLVGGNPARRLVAFNDPKGDVALLDPVANKSYWPDAAVAAFGQLHLAVPMPDPPPAVARASLPVLTADPGEPATAPDAAPVS
jgi:hypothetical protein